MVDGIVEAQFPGCSRHDGREADRRQRRFSVDQSPLQGIHYGVRIFISREHHMEWLTFIVEYIFTLPVMMKQLQHHISIHLIQLSQQLEDELGELLKTGILVTPTLPDVAPFHGLTMTRPGILGVTGETFQN